MAANEDARTLLVVVAHPDDESFGCGALIAAAAGAGIRVIVVCASRGELGEDASGLHPDRESLAAAREAELYESAAMLGASEVVVLGLIDSGWDGAAGAGAVVAEPEQLRQRISDVLRKYRPGVVVTMDPTGSDGHRDHAAVGRATTVAFDQTVDWPASLYHWCLPHSLMDAWAREVAAQDPDSVYLETELGRPDDQVTTILDGATVVGQVWRAIANHRTQKSPYEGISAELAERFVRYDYLIRQRPPWPDATGALEAGRTPLEKSLLWPEFEPEGILP